ncbi:MAG: protein translocase subunit SecD [Coriobacteriia bacterium]|nr:protein translocase subunit SecD [Coriobacteriia bacterium]
MESRSRNIIALVVIAVLAAVSLWQVWPPSEKITQGLDIKGGLSVILSAEPLSGQTMSEDTMQRVEDILVERVNGFGVSEATVQRQGQTAFLIQLPGVDNAQEALKLLGEPGKLEFIDFSSITDTATAGLILQQLEARSSTEPTATLPKLTDEPYVGTYEAFMTGEVITDAQISTDQYGNPSVSVTMSKTGVEKWAEVTTRLSASQGQVVIVLDGIAKSAPAVQEPILTGDTEISGTFTVDEAKALSAVLQSGAMPADIEIDESRVVGPTLGQDSLNQGLLAGLIGLAFVAAFMALYYRGLGVLSWVSLALYGVIFGGVLAVLSSLNIFSMTLPGIAGIILTIGVAADTSILIFERLKEEVEAGKTYRSAAKSGVRHAIATSIDADVVTLVSALALWFLAIGPVKGFAFTLILGIIIDLVVAILFTGPVVRMLAEGLMTKTPALFGVKGGGQRG